MWKSPNGVLPGAVLDNPIVDTRAEVWRMSVDCQGPQTGAQTKEITDVWNKEGTKELKLVCSEQTQTQLQLLFVCTLLSSLFCVFYYLFSRLPKEKVSHFLNGTQRDWMKNNLIRKQDRTWISVSTGVDSSWQLFLFFASIWLMYFLCYFFPPSKTLLDSSFIFFIFFVQGQVKMLFSRGLHWQTDVQ